MGRPAGARAVSRSGIVIGGADDDSDGDERAVVHQACHASARRRTSPASA